MTDSQNYPGLDTRLPLLVLPAPVGQVPVEQVSDKPDNITVDSDKSESDNTLLMTRVTISSAPPLSPKLVTLELSPAADEAKPESDSKIPVPERKYVGPPAVAFLIGLDVSFFFFLQALFNPRTQRPVQQNKH